MVSSSTARERLLEMQSREYLTDGGVSPLEKRAGARRPAGIIAQEKPAEATVFAAGSTLSRQGAMDKFKAYRIHEIEKKAVARFEDLSLEDSTRARWCAWRIRASTTRRARRDRAGRIIRRFPCVAGSTCRGR